MGTPGYIAPELYLGGPLDHRIDIFSAGVLFYHLLARQAPFKGRAEAVMHDVCYHDPEPPSEVDPQHRWPHYDAIVAQALAKSPADRYPSAAAFRAAILAEYAQPLANTLSETTIITNVVRPLGVEPSTPSAAPKTVQTTPLGTSTPPPSGWSTTVLAGVEVELARFVGPVAKVLVRRAARDHKQLDELVGALVESLDTKVDREAFARAVLGRHVMPARISGYETPLPQTNPPSGPPLTPADLEMATKLLATYIGPIARVIAKRAAAATGTRREFLNEVAQSIETDAQRERFLRDAKV
jgi:serine/threonine-protein kinase